MVRSWIGRATPLSMRGLLLALVLVSLVPMLLLQVRVYREWFDSRREAQVQGSHALARQIATTFDEYIRDLGRQEQSIAAALAAMQPFSPEQAHQYLAANLHEYPAILNLHWLDPGGTIIASSNPNALGVHLGDREIFKHALEARTWVLGDMLIGRVVQRPVFSVARCLRNQVDQAQGILLTTVDPERLNEVFRLEEDASGTILLTDRSGRVIYTNPPLSLTWQQRAWGHTQPLLQEAVRQGESAGTMVCLTGQPMLVASVQVDGTGWVVTVGHPQAAVAGPVWHDMIKSNGVSLVVLLLATLGALLIARCMHRGLASLRRHVNALSRGENSIRGKPEGLCDLEDLGEAIDEMAANRRQAEEQLRLVLQTLPVGVLFTDQDGRIIESNAASRRIWEGARFVGPAEYGQYRGWWADTGRLIEPQEWAVARALSRGETSINEVIDIECFDGSRKTIHNSAAPIRDQQGRIIGALIVNQDITEQRLAEKALREMNETLEQRVAERTAEAERRTDQLRRLTAELVQAEERERRRLAQVLHDHLQQLLVSARFGLSTLRSQLPDVAVPRQSLKQVDDLLQESIAASRSLTAELSPPMLYEAGLAQALEWLAGWMLERHGLLVEVQADSQANPDERVRVLLFQAVRELLFNIVKHACTDRAQVRMALTDDRLVRISVRDAGVGFDPREAGLRPASGFGLFSLHERLEVLGGRLTIDSTPGAGTRIELTAPLRLSQEPDEVPVVAPPLRVLQEVEARPAPAAAQVCDAPIRILLADDHVVVRDGLAQLLSSHQAMQVVGAAADGLEAVELAARLQPDLVLMDVSMPRMNGIEATRWITEQLPHVRVVGLSMHAESDMAEPMRRAGACGYVAKSSGPAVLIDTIHSCMGRNGSGSVIVTG